MGTIYGGYMGRVVEVNLNTQEVKDYPWNDRERELFRMSTLFSLMVRADWDGISAIPATFLAVSLGFNITENLGAYIESYNYFVKYGIRNTEAECNLDFGFSYQVHPRVQLDIYGAFNCQDPKSFACIGLGVAWMIH